MSKTLNWEDFQEMGNPDAVELPESVDEDTPTIDKKVPVRIYLERKGRGGKTVSIIKGIVTEKSMRKKMLKKLKSNCGVGGYLENEDIVIQGDQRSTLQLLLEEEGFTDVKNAGA